MLFWNMEIIQVYQKQDLTVDKNALFGGWGLFHFIVSEIHSEWSVFVMRSMLIYDSNEYKWKFFLHDKRFRCSGHNDCVWACIFYTWCAVRMGFLSWFYATNDLWLYDSKSINLSCWVAELWVCDRIRVNKCDTEPMESQYYSNASVNNENYT